MTRTIEATQQSYRGLLKASALIGSSSLVVVMIGVVRTKCFAVLLGPAGFGLVALYTAIVDLACSIAGMGINASGVRQIADANASGDSVRIAHMAFVLRRTALVLGALGAIVLAAGSGLVSSLTFGSSTQAGAITLLALAVMFRLLAEGQTALLQGLRRIGDLARVNMLSALLATLAAVPLVFFLRIDGVVPALVVGAALGALVAWWHSRSAASQGMKALAAGEFRSKSTALLKLGFAFMASGLLMLGTAYLVRLILANKIGIEAAGLFQSSWTLGGLYIGFILQAMGTDFYPRLVAAVSRHDECNRLVNDQAHISLLLAGPGVLATLALAAPTIHLFYSSEFGAAIPVLRWICLGMALRVITWPIGYIVVAKGNQTIFIACELAWTVVNLGLTWFLVDAFGVEGAGIAFFLSYVFHGFLIFPVVRRMTGFGWSRQNVATGLTFVVSIATVFAVMTWLRSPWSIGIALFITAVSALVSLRLLMRSTGTGYLPPKITRLLARLRFADPRTT
jgi:enterobacterial common antigen flippase